MKALVIFSIISTLIHLEVKCQASKDLNSFIKSVSEELKRRRDFLEKEWNSRCSKKQCTESNLICYKSDPDLTCSPSFDINRCECFNTPGSLVNLKESSVQIANRPTIQTQAITEMSCVISPMDDFFKQSLDSFPGVHWQYVGTYNGLHRTYPGHELKCDYDPRYRPWYVAAASGAKNIILIIDSSNSMDEFLKLEGAKEATKQL